MPNEVFLDASYAVALSSTRDLHHARAVALAGCLTRIIREGRATSIVEARPARARRATRALPTADGASLSRREGACPPPLRDDGIVSGSTRT